MAAINDVNVSNYRPMNHRVAVDASGTEQSPMPDSAMKQIIFRRARAAGCAEI
jgi:hypothetical protein